MPVDRNERIHRVSLQLPGVSGADHLAREHHQRPVTTALRRGSDAQSVTKVAWSIWLGRTRQAHGPGEASPGPCAWRVRPSQMDHATLVTLCASLPLRKAVVTGRWWCSRAR